MKESRFYEKLIAFDWTDLAGKTLEIRVGSDSSEKIQTTVIAGYERSTGKYYLIAERLRSKQKQSRSSEQ